MNCSVFLKFSGSDLMKSKMMKRERRRKCEKVQTHEPTPSNTHCILSEHLSESHLADSGSFNVDTNTFSSTQHILIKSACLMVKAKCCFMPQQNQSWSCLPSSCIKTSSVSFIESKQSLLMSDTGGDHQ